MLSLISLWQDACEALLQGLLSEVGGEGPGRPPGAAGGFVLVMDGRTLEWALQDELKGAFLELSRQCKAVLCCRSTPLQKSQVVQLVRRELGVMTLAIGEEPVGSADHTPGLWDGSDWMAWFAMWWNLSKAIQPDSELLYCRIKV